MLTHLLSIYIYIWLKSRNDMLLKHKQGMHNTTQHINYNKYTNSCSMAHTCTDQTHGLTFLQKV